MEYIDSLLNTAAIFMRKFIKVVPVEGNNLLENGNERCSHYVDVPDNDKQNGIENSDLHLYVK